MLTQDFKEAYRKEVSSFVTHIINFLYNSTRTLPEGSEAFNLDLPSLFEEINRIIDDSSVIPRQERQVVLALLVGYAPAFYENVEGWVNSKTIDHDLFDLAYAQREILTIVKRVSPNMDRIRLKAIVENIRKYEIVEITTMTDTTSGSGNLPVVMLDLSYVDDFFEKHSDFKLQAAQNGI